MYEDKPLSSIRAISHHISQPDKIVAAPRGSFISFDNSHIPDFVLLHHGIALLRRRTDNMIVGHISEPEIFGFNRYIRAGEQIYLEALNDIKFEILPVDLMFQKIAQYQLWAELVDMTMYLMSSIFDNYSQLVQRDAFRIVSAHLRALSKAPPEFINAISIPDYIKQRTHLSRNNILKQLVILRKNGSLQMEKDRFKSFIHVI